MEISEANLTLQTPERELRASNNKSATLHQGYSKNEVPPVPPNLALGKGGLNQFDPISDLDSDYRNIGPF